jgi:glycosyltransferase involved in cell wall biosynthesis
MKVLYISPVRTSSRKGESTHFLELGKKLENHGNKLLIICREGKEKLHNLSVKYVPNIEIRYLTTFITDFLLSLYLIFYLLIFRPDVVYYRGVTLGGVFSRMFRIASVAEANGIYPDEVEMERPRFYRCVGILLRLREKINYSFATRIICVTSGIKRELVKNYGVKDNTCKVIPNGVNNQLFGPVDKIACRRELRLEKDYFYVGFVGSFQRWQGLDTLVEALKVVKEKKYNSIRCVLVGDGDLMEHIKAMVKRYGLEEEIIFTGRIRYEEVSAFINSFDVCLAPFKWQRNSKIGLSPLKLYEYLACAKPVIASNINGVTEIIEDGNCGYIFEPDNMKELALKIIQSYRERDKLTELGNNGRAFVEATFSWEKIGEGVEKVLREAIEISGRN